MLGVFFFRKLILAREGVWGLWFLSLVLLILVNVRLALQNLLEREGKIILF